MCQVQSRVKAKYDQWHRDLLNSFGEKASFGVQGFNSVEGRAL